MHIHMHLSRYRDENVYNRGGRVPHLTNLVLITYSKVD